LYELFTGKRALEGSNLAELIAKREQGSVTPPGEIVRGLDTIIERVIMRCLEPDPARRPASALAVAAALPGGDPLAAALAAGETPSPELVAAAGQAEGLSPRVAWTCLLVTAAGIAVFAMLSRPCSLLRLAPVDRSPAALEDRARDLVRTLASDA